MPAVIFNGSKVKTLKDTISINGNCDIISGSADPSITATVGTMGSLYQSTGTGYVYRKLDNGSSTNWEVVGSGSSGSKNYAKGNDSTADTVIGSNWSTFDATAYPPTSYSGGTVTATFARTTSSPLQGSGSMLFTPGGQYDSAKFAFTIDRADFARMFKIEFDYEITSYANYADGDLKLAVISAQDTGFTTNLEVVQPAGHSILKVAGVETHVATFQSHASNLYYRVCLVQTTTNTTYTSLKIDNFKVGPQSVAYGAPVTDWVSYTPTVTNLPITSNSSTWRRVGDSAEVRIDLLASGAATGVISVQLPSGLSVDTAKLSVAGATGYGHPGTATALVAGGEYSGEVEFSASTNAFYFQNITSGAQWAASVPATWNSASRLYARLTVPILGWSSSVLMSDSADTRVVAMNTPGVTATGTLTNSFNVTKFGSVSGDSHSAYSTSTGLYTIQVPGKYIVHGQIVNTANYTVGQNTQIAVYKNGTSGTRLGGDGYVALGTENSRSTTLKFSGSIDCVAGDTLGVYAYTTAGSPIYDNTFGGSFLNISKISGPAQIAASEVVYARYGLDTSSAAPSGGSINTGSSSVLDYDYKFRDTHGAVTTGSGWKFTAPVNGIYEISAGVVVIGVGGMTAGGNTYLAVFKNGSGSRDSILGSVALEVAGGIINPRPSGTACIELLAGEYIQVKLFNNLGANSTISRSADDAQITIRKIG